MEAAGVESALRRRDLPRSNRRASGTPRFLVPRFTHRGVALRLARHVYAPIDSFTDKHSERSAELTAHEST